MTNRDLVRLLQIIRDLALLGYPFPEGDREERDAAIVLALGEIAGRAQAVLGRRATPVSRSSTAKRHKEGKESDHEQP